MRAHSVSPAASVMPAAPTKQWLAQSVHKALEPGGISPYSPIQHACAERGRGDATGFAACTLEDHPQSARAARRFTTTTLRGWEMAELVDSVAIIVSELVSNALRYGLTGPQMCPSRPKPIWLGLLRQETVILCAVFDPGANIPVVKEPDYLAESGRGLHVIDLLSDSWGWTQPDTTGKAVWAMLSVPSRGASGQSLGP